MSATSGARTPLGRLAQVVERLERTGLLEAADPADVALYGITDDSRRVEAGDLFCAWRGTHVDAHDHVGAAEAAGAAAALLERRVADSRLPQVVVRSGRRGAAFAAAELFGQPARQLAMIGITGTNGKTTTAWIARHLLEVRGVAASIGTLGVVAEDATVGDPDTLTTPGPVDLARTLRNLVERGVTSLAMEVSSHALHQGRVAALEFDAAVFTNFSRDHLDYHGTEEAYLQAKLSLLDLIRPAGVAVLNADDPAWAPVAAAAPRRMTFSATDGAADLRAERVALERDGARFRLVTPAGAWPVHLPLLGDYNVMNALGAVGAALAVGVEAERIAARLATVPQVPGRLERIADRPCPVLRDYAHTPDALERALATLRPLVAGRLVVVFGAGGDRDRGKRPLMGRAVERWADHAIVTSDNPRTEDPEAIIDEILAGMSGRYTREPDRRKAIALALTGARPEDLVLLAGKGHETYQVLGTEKVPCDEREIVAEWLRQTSGAAPGNHVGGDGAAGPRGE